jgi:SpoVK/Ycf46/Vps4 family AAA+-type ATPase
MKDLDPYDELMTQNKFVTDLVRGVVSGLYNGVYLYGRPGTSKTYLVKTMLKSLLDNNFQYIEGYLTPRALFDLIRAHPEGVIVLDDVSEIFRHRAANEILLAALGTGPHGSKVRSVRYMTARGSEEVEFRGGIICISNRSLDRSRDAVRDALNSRVHVHRYEPTDEQIKALIAKLGVAGVRGVPPDASLMVARYLLAQCDARGKRPSVRLFLDKALRDYQLYAEGKSELDWRDLVVAHLEEQPVPLQHPTTDLSRADEIEADRRIALAIYFENPKLSDRIAAWKNQTGKSQAAFYRRIGELKQDGRIADQVRT